MRRRVSVSRSSRSALATAILMLLPVAPVFSQDRSDSADAAAGAAGLVRIERGGEAPALVRTYGRANYVWPYSAGPYYGDEARGLESSTGLLRTPVGAFDLPKGRLPIPEELRVRRLPIDTGARYFIVQLDRASMAHGSLERLRVDLERAGAAIVQFMPVAAMIVRLTPAARASLDANADVIAVEPYHPALKLHPTIGRVPLADPLKAVSEVYDLEIRVFDGEGADAVGRRIEELGGTVNAVYPDTVRAEIHRSKLADVAAIDAVQMVFEYIPRIPLGEETTTTLQTGRYNSGGLPYHDAGVDGGGNGLAPAQILMIVDTGIQLDAGDLSDTKITAGTPGPAHRKVLAYLTTGAFGGVGDGSGCDAPPSGGSTHGHVVAATAVGNATNVNAAAYGGTGWMLTDTSGNRWEADGVAKGALLVAYDAQLTPAATSCGDPLQNTVTPGDLYSGGSTGSLGSAHATYGAKTYNLSWGATSNVYSPDAQDVDRFILDKGDAMVFVSAGNAGLDGDNDGAPDPGSLGTPATTKNGLAIGASRAANDLAAGGREQEKRHYFSSVGPSPGGRVAPQLMSPGGESGGVGLPSEYACRSNDNDSADPVECDTAAMLQGTSFSSAGAAGAALLVRDYFAQGFYPDGTSTDPGNVADRIANVSGALVKAALVASASFLEGDRPPAFSGHFRRGDGLTVPYRFNNEQGYGRIELDNVLPLTSWPTGVSGLLVQDSVVLPVVGGIAGMATSIDAVAGGTTSGTFRVCHSDDELRVALAWFDEVGESLINDLDLDLQSPSGRLYRGNYFTDDDDRDGVLDPNEDCPDIDGVTGTLSQGDWSIPACTRADLTPSPFDRANPTEAIMLSPDPLATGSSPAPQSQIETGTWTVRVSSPGGGTHAAQTFALVISGGVCAASWVRLDAAEYACNSTAHATIYELPEGGDPNPSAATVGARTVVEVLDPNGVVVDSESGVTFTQSAAPALVFEGSTLVLTASTARDPGNGALDVRDGDSIRVLYHDITGTRSSSARVSCTPRIRYGSIVFGQFGQDATHLVEGGCERSARGGFEFGFPDRYMDAGETIGFNLAFGSVEAQDLVDVEADLRCVYADEDSPSDCHPDSVACSDPRRANNRTCDGREGFGGAGTALMSILDTPKRISRIPAGWAQAVAFAIRMADTIAGTPEVEMILQLRAESSGKTASSLTVSRQRVDVDEQSLFYSTDYPTGGTQFFDFSPYGRGDEILENPVPNDYRFETLTWSDLTAGGAKNTGLQSPWNFDADDGGFRSGLLATSDESTITNTIAQWGEDKNFNGQDDKRCTLDITRACFRDSDCTGHGLCQSVEDRDPVNGVLDKSWNIRGGCGWQTKPVGTCSNASTHGCFSNADCPGGTCTGTATTGGIWHTGRIGGTTGNCLVTGNDPGQCQAYETVGGTQGIRSWREHLITPVMQKVNGDDYEIEIVQWRWNQALDLADNNAAWTWEFDTDVLALRPVDLFSDNAVLDGLFGGFGAVNGTNNPGLIGGYSMFAPLTANMQNSFNGSLGHNRQGKNACYFEGGNVDDVFCPGCPLEPGSLGLARPLDNDLDDDGDGQIDEYVTANGPVRNMDIGLDMRWSQLEDYYGRTGQFFQGSIGFWAFERSAAEQDPRISYGLGIDDVVVEWREFTLVKDAADCAAGECAVVDVGPYFTFAGGASITVTVLEKSPDPLNDCDLDGTPDTTVGGRFALEGDCNDDNRRDLVVRATSNTEFQGEILFVDATEVPNHYVGELPVSARYDSPGVLFVAQQGTDYPVVTVTYADHDDGTGVPCKNDVDPAAQGLVQAGTVVVLNLGQIQVGASMLSDNGDNDGFADTSETVSMRIRVGNKSGDDLTRLVARLSTNSPRIDCILDSFVFIGDLAAGAETLATDSFTFRVADVDRAALGLSDLDDLSAEFNIGFSSDQFDGLVAPQSVVVDLDLDATGVGGPTTFFEGFESGTLGTFEPQNLDASLNSLQASDGYRCQYSDPDWTASNNYGQPTDCFLGASPAHADAFFWSIHSPSANRIGRAFSGNHSLYMGIFLANDVYTTPAAVLEAVRTTNPINLGSSGAPPELTYKQQVDLMDSRTVNAPPGDAPGRYVTMLQLADGAGAPVGDWLKLEPYLNVYDQQGVDNYVNCVFDPIDDGNDEDDFFDPTDPDRRLGPSSTCKPEFAFVYLGETFLPFSESHLGNAEGPGLRGALGKGTWVESRFNLERFRGRRVRLRFLNTDIKVGTAQNWAAYFPSINPGPGEDGIWIDDVQVTNILTTPVTMSADNKNNSALPACGNTCSTIIPVLTADPPGRLAAPGQVVELSAIESIADRCLGGTLQYRFWIDGNRNGVGGDPADILMRGWADDPSIVDAPEAPTRYVVQVRCSTLTSCLGSTSLNVSVDCPTSGNLTFPEVAAPSKTAFVWSRSLTYDFAAGLLSVLSAGTYATTGNGQNQGPGTSHSTSADSPSAGTGVWYVFRESGPLGGGGTAFCNAPPLTWGSVARDANLP